MWTLRQLNDAIMATDGAEFGVRFIKRTNKELREMRCKIGVTEHLTPEPTRDGLEFKAYRLVGVYDLDREGYRSIPLEGIVALKLKDEWIQIEIKV